MCLNNRIFPDFDDMKKGKPDSVFVSEHFGMLRRVCLFLTSAVENECLSASCFCLVYDCFLYECVSGKHTSPWKTIAQRLLFFSGDLIELSIYLSQTIVDIQ